MKRCLGCRGCPSTGGADDERSPDGGDIVRRRACEGGVSADERVPQRLPAPERDDLGAAAQDVDVAVSGLPPARPSDPMLRHVALEQVNLLPDNLRCRVERHARSVDSRRVRRFCTYTPLAHDDGRGWLRTATPRKFRVSHFR